MWLCARASPHAGWLGRTAACHWTQDAGATKVEVKLKEFGANSIEVVDNGTEWRSAVTTTPA